MMSGFGGSSFKRPKLIFVSEYDQNAEDTPSAEQERLDRKTELVWHKIQHNIKATITIKNTLNLGFVFFICAVCVQQCHIAIKDYLKYPTRIQVMHGLPPSTLLLLPGITICNNNRFRLDKLSQDVPGLSRMVKNATSNVNKVNYGSLTNEQRAKHFVKVNKILEKTGISLNNLISESSVYTLWKLSHKLMVMDINCNAIWGREFNCENFRIIESYQWGPCYTLFYRGAIFEAITSGKAYEFNSSLLGGPRKIDSFVSHEIAEVLIDFDPLQHADMQRDTGGKVLIHSSTEIGNVRDTVFPISPGYSYDFIISRQISERLPPPYDSKCYHYMRENSHHFKGGKTDAEASVELDRRSCLRNCLLRETIRACNCWPIEVCYFPNDTRVSNLTGPIKMCPWGDEVGGKDATYSVDKYINCYKKFIPLCLEECPLDCVAETYQVQIRHNRWPTREMFFRASESESVELKKLKGCCAKLSVKYLEFMENRLVEYPKITLAQMVSNIGGIVSALVGVSAVTVYRFITRKIFRFKVVSDKCSVAAVAGANNGTRKQHGLAGLKKRVGLYKQVARISPANRT